MLLRLIDSSALLAVWTVQKCIKVDQTHQELACGKLLLQKVLLYARPDICSCAIRLFMVMKASVDSKEHYVLLELFTSELFRGAPVSMKSCSR